MNAVPECEPIDLVAKVMVADLHAQPDEVQAAFRYLYARVALDEGLLELVGHEVRPSGERLVCREPDSGKFYAVERPATWSVEDEGDYVEKMRRCLLRPSSDGAH